MGVTFVDGAVRVRVPATSANLGPGFDALGLALALHDDVAAWVTDRGWHVDVAGEGAGELPTGADHLVARAMAATFERLGGQPPGVAIECVNRIPQARGLGSSSAAIVAGVQLARALVRDGTTILDDAAALALAAQLEGHPDNVAPCLLGGFVIAWSDEVAGDLSRPSSRAVRLTPAEGIRPTVFIPDDRGLTATARAALPATVPHRDAAFTAGRAALLVHALTGASDLLFPATADKLHQDYRAAGMPATAALVDELRGRGVAAVVSGAGPSVLALTSPPDDLAELLAGLPALAGIGWRVVELAIDVAGARIGSGRLGHAERAPVAAGRKS